MYTVSVLSRVPPARIVTKISCQNRTSVEMTINSELLPNTITITISYGN